MGKSAKGASRARPHLEQILKTLRTHLPELKERYRIRTLGVFGSYVRGQPRGRSDLDILVEFDDCPGLFGFVDLKNHLSDLLNIKVDLVMKDALKPRIGQRILSEVIQV